MTITRGPDGAREVADRVGRDVGRDEQQRHAAGAVRAAVAEQHREAITPAAAGTTNQRRRAPIT